MAVNGNFGVLRKISQLKYAVRRAEKKLAPESMRASLSPYKWTAFATTGPRFPAYAATHPKVLLHIFHKLNFPGNSRFADLGSGVGMPCFIASFFFDHVTGFEFDKRLLHKAEGIRRMFRLNNIEFKNTDFLKADLTPYNVLFMYWPFENNFAELMHDKLKETKPGTFIISYKFTNKIESIFNKEDFKEEYPGLYQYYPENLLPSTYVFRRK